MPDSPVSPRFSVLIAAFNAEPFIGRAIESILTQTYSAHEIVVVDDGSTDGTSREVARFGEAVRCLSQGNAGVSAARNLAASVATGDWLAFLDADDWYYPDRLRWHAELLAAHPDLDFLSGDYDYRNTDGSLIGRSIETVAFGREVLADRKIGRGKVLSNDEIARYAADYFGCILTFTIPRPLFLRLGGFPVGFAVAEDLHLLVRACARARQIGVVGEPMGAYRIHDRSAVRRDHEAAQREAVRTLAHLNRSLGDAPAAVRGAAKSLLRESRLNLAYAALRARGRIAGLQAALPLLAEDRSFRTLRDLASIGRG